MTVADVVAQRRDGRLEDFVREALVLVAWELMEAEISSEIGAELGRVAPEARITHRNGYRPRPWETRVGELELLIPRMRQGSRCTAQRFSLPQRLLIWLIWVAARGRPLYASLSLEAVAIAFLVALLAWILTPVLRAQTGFRAFIASAEQVRDDRVRKPASGITPPRRFGASAWFQRRLPRARKLRGQVLPKPVCKLRRCVRGLRRVLLQPWQAHDPCVQCCLDCLDFCLDNNILCPKNDCEDCWKYS